MFKNEGNDIYELSIMQNLKKIHRLAYTPADVKISHWVEFWVDFLF